MTIKGKYSAIFLAVALLAAPGVGAEEADKPKRQFTEKQLAQHQRMRDCNGEAKKQGLKADDRKAYMKTCLSAGKVTAEAGEQSGEAPDAEAAAMKAQRKTCSAEAKAKELKGDARKAHMAQCLAATGG